MFAEVLTEDDIGRWFGIIIACVFVFALLRKQKFGFRGSEHGTARWADDDGLKKRGLLDE
jgi:hypothetical protein